MIIENKYHNKSLSISDIFAENTTHHLDIGEYYSGINDVRKVFSECMDMKDRFTRETLLSMNEADHSKVLNNLTVKLYSHIVNKTKNIDYSDISKSNGDITKIDSYNQLMDCIEVMKNILEEYHQKNTAIDDIIMAVTNVKTLQDQFIRSYRYKVDLAVMLYENIVLAIYSGLSYLISGCIEFIKNPSDDSFNISLDKVAAVKTKDHILFNSIKKFNNSCKSGKMAETLDYLISKKARGIAGIITVGVVAGVSATVLAIILNIIPICRELVYIFYRARVGISDFCEQQADLLQMNAYNIRANNTMNDIKRSDIANKQEHIAEKFRSISDKITIDKKNTDVNGYKDLKNDNQKYKIEEIQSNFDDDNSESLF